ncbi:MAG: glycosyltransferase family 4 protein [Sphingopyxis sp.]|nr:glycosyltransferase family 4 protein [Sphingopyxis sp.]
MLRVLIIDGVGMFGGASRSLFESMRGFREPVDRLFFVQKGSANDYYRPYGSDMIAVRGITRFDNSRASHYRGARWLVLGREIAYLPWTIVGLLKAKRRWKRVDLIHVNEVMEILPGILAKILFRAPMVVHVRSLIWTDRTKLRVRLLDYLLRRYADAVVAIDEDNRVRLNPELRAEVIHNSLDHVNMPAGSDVPTEALSRIPSDAFVVGFIGNLHAGKGVFELLEAAEIVRKAGANVHFLIVGSSQRSDGGAVWTILNRLGLAQEQEAAFTASLEQKKLTPYFHFAGHTTNIAPWIEAMDVLTFPSHFDACGRPVFEAAFFGRPSIVAVAAPKDDTLQNGVTGIAIARPDPQLLADAILELAADPERTRAMGSAARALAHANFTPEINSAKLLNLYKRVAANKQAQPEVARDVRLSEDALP